MSLISLIILIIVAGVVLWAINSFVPMEARLKQLLNVIVILVVAIIAVVWILGFLGVSISGGPVVDMPGG